MKLTVFTNLLDAMDFKMEDKDIERMLRTYAEKVEGGKGTRINYREVVGRLRYRESDTITVNDSVSQVHRGVNGQWTLQSNLPELVKAKSQADILSRYSRKSGRDVFSGKPSMVGASGPG